MGYLKIRPYRKAYDAGNGQTLIMQPVICSNCGYDSAMDEIGSYKYCPNCGDVIEGVKGNILENSTEEEK